MRFRGNLFLWVFVATAIPLMGLALGATYYSQQRYETEINARLNTTLTNLVAEVERRLQSERDMVRGLTQLPQLKAFLPMVSRASEGHHPVRYETTYQSLYAALHDYIGLLPEHYTVRVLDRAANTLLKVDGDFSGQRQFETLEGVPLAEPELADGALAAELARLPANEVGYALLPQAHQQGEENPVAPMLDYILPLEYQGLRIGYITVSSFSSYMDRIFNYANRDYEGRLIVAELNPAQPDRNGMLIYDDRLGLHFEQPKYRPSYMAQQGYRELWEVSGQRQFGVVKSLTDDTSYHYVEYYPYPTRLLSWLVAMRVNDDLIQEPFARVRWWIWGIVGLALVLSLLITQFGVRQIATPLSRLAEAVKRYADGEPGLRVGARGTEEVKQVAESFNYLADSLDHTAAERDKAQSMVLRQAKLASLGEMAAGIGHELNNPLNNILSYAKLAQRSTEDTAMQADLEALREEALRASTIVKGVLNFSRQVEPHYSDFILREWLEESLALVRQLARQRGVDIALYCPEQMQQHGDRVQLQQVLINLLNNALQASSAGQVIEVHVRHEGQRNIIDIIDEGSGIEPADLDKVFDPFFTTKGVGEGSGLGLSISLGIVEQHGGELSLQANPGGGTVARIILPQPGAATAENT